MYLKDKSSEFKVKFRHASNHCQKVLEAVKPGYADKTKEFVKGKSAITSLFNGLEELSSASDKPKLFVENFSKNSNN